MRIGVRFFKRGDFTIYVNGVEIKKVDLYAISRELTGTDNETGNGVFSGSSIVSFYQNGVIREVEFDAMLSQAVNAEGVINIIRERVKVVRELFSSYHEEEF